MNGKRCGWWLKCSLATAFAVTFCGCVQSAKPAPPPDEYRTAKAKCSEETAAQNPPQIRRVTTSPGYVTPIRSNCTKDQTGKERCTSSGGEYVPPVFSDIDDNLDARRRAVEQCLHDLGLSPQKK